MRMNNGKTAKRQPNCYVCQHFFITHEPANPYGCKAMGFKSTRQPSEVVLTSSGMFCQMFQSKSSGKRS